MCELLRAVAGPVVGGAISGVLGLLFFERQRRVHAQDAFCETTAQLRAKLAAYMRENRENDFYAESVPILSQASYRVRRFLNKEARARLESIMQEYQAEDNKQFGKRASIAEGAVGVDFNLPGAMTLQQRLTDFLDRFDACVHKPV